MRFSQTRVFLLVAAAAFVSACATPAVVQTVQPRDAELSCAQIGAALAEARSYETKARAERGVTGTNVAAAIFFWPAMIGTYKNTEEAINAARERQNHLQVLASRQNCRL
ncbi:MAG: hypothetical protein Q7J33_11945 [Serpentinimonas sp.]|nr:hypothetical protein [Serpentinimonas sp.]